MSEKKNDGGPASPMKTEETIEGINWPVHYTGLSIRDYFAGQALTGIMAGVCTGHQIDKPGEAIKVDESIVKTTYIIADAMLEARK